MKGFEHYKHLKAQIENGTFDNEGDNFKDVIMLINSSLPEYHVSSLSSSDIEDISLNPHSELENQTLEFLINGENQGLALPIEKPIIVEDNVSAVCLINASQAGTNCLYILNYFKAKGDSATILGEGISINREEKRLKFNTHNLNGGVIVNSVYTPLNFENPHTISNTQQVLISGAYYTILQYVHLQHKQRLH